MNITLSGLPDVVRAKQIVCALLQCSGGKFEGKTRLNKAFWWAHVHYYRHHPGLLSRYPIARLTEGPAIDEADSLLASLERDRHLAIHGQPKGPYLEEVYELRKPWSDQLPEVAIDSIQHAVEWVRDKTAVEVSQASHRLSRSWQAAKDGDIIDIANDTLSEDDLRDTQTELDRIDKNLADARNAAQQYFGG